MTQPPQGPWRPTGPLPPPRARPLPPRPVAYGPPPGPHPHRPTRPYEVPPPPPRYPPPYPPRHPQHGPGPVFGPGPARYPPGRYPPPGTPPWPHYPGHQHLPRPRGKSNTAALVGTLVVVVLLAAVALVGVLAVTGEADSVADTGYDDPAATTTTSTSDQEPTATYDPSTETTTETTTETGTTGTTGDTPTETTQAGPRPVYALEDNPLFAGDVGTPAVTCALAPWDTSPAGAAAFFRSALPCLDAAWRPVMEYQGLPFSTPGIAFPEGTEWSSPCGDVSAGGGAVAAFYCSYDNTLYMPFAGLQTEVYGARPGVYLAVLAHEYGHHVQAMSGVMDTYWDARYDAGADTGAGLELSRRFELQAQCLSGMFLAATYGRGSVDDTVLTDARTTQDRGDHNPGAPRDHGSDAHAIAWWEQGAQLNRTYQCNTWLSPPEDVS